MPSVKRKHDEHETFINSNTIVDVLSYNSVFSFIFRVIDSDLHKYNGWVLKMCVLTDYAYDLPPFIDYQKASVTPQNFKNEVDMQRKVYGATLKYDPHGFCPYISLFGELFQPLPFLNNIALRDEVDYDPLLYLKRIFIKSPSYQLGYIIMKNVSEEYVPIEGPISAKDETSRWIALHAWARLLLIYRDTAIIHIDAHDHNVFCKREVDRDTPSAVTILDFGKVYTDVPHLTEIDTIDELFLMIQRFAQNDFRFNGLAKLQCEVLLRVLFPYMSPVPNKSVVAFLDADRESMFDRKMVTWTKDTNAIYSRNLTDLLGIMRNLRSRVSLAEHERLSVVPPSYGFVDASAELTRHDPLRSGLVGARMAEHSSILDEEAAERARKEQEASARKSYKNMIRDRDREAIYSKAKQDADAELDQQVQEELDRQEQEKEKQKQERLVQLKYNNKLKKYVLAGAVVVAAAYLLSGRTKKRRRRTKRRN